ncbi:MAG: TetR/AcrR family transcriptional regulator [bacterium]|nr:TetR/AcrR family transcriptional regulator [bacterium]
MAGPSTASRVDGRLARGERARGAIVDALLDLLEAGELRPSAARIAERAGVSLRSVFQHFSDVETLFATAAERQKVRLMPLVRPISLDGPLAERIAAFASQRAKVLEAITPVRRAAILMEPFSRELHVRLASFRNDKGAEVQRVFAREIAARPSASRRPLVAALVVASGWTTWQGLREHQGLDRTQARRVLAHMLTALLHEER